MEFQHFWHEFPQAFCETARKRGALWAADRAWCWNCTEFCSFFSSSWCIFLAGQRTPLYERTGVKSWKYFNLRLCCNTWYPHDAPNPAINPTAKLLPSKKTWFIQAVHSWLLEATKQQLRAGWNTTRAIHNITEHRTEKLQGKNAALEVAACKGGTLTALDNITEIGSITQQQMWNPDLNYSGSEMQRGYRRHLPNTHSSTWFCFWAQIFLFDALQALKPPLWHHLEYLFNCCVGHKKETSVSWVKKFTFFFRENLKRSLKWGRESRGV